MRIAIDFELVYDVWSLMFCILRMEEPTLLNDDYPRVIYKDPAEVFNEH